MPGSCRNRELSSRYWRAHRSASEQDRLASSRPAPLFFSPSRAPPSVPCCSLLRVPPLPQLPRLAAAGRRVAQGDRRLRRSACALLRATHPAPRTHTMHSARLCPPVSPRLPALRCDPASAKICHARHRKRSACVGGETQRQACERTAAPQHRAGSSVSAPSDQKGSGSTKTARAADAQAERAADARARADRCQTADAFCRQMQHDSGHPCGPVNGHSDAIPDAAWRRGRNAARRWRRQRGGDAMVASAASKDATAERDDGYAPTRDAARKDRLQ